MTGKRVPMPSKEVLERMYTEDGMDQYQIKKHFGVGRSTVSVWLKHYNISTRFTGTLKVEMPPKSELEQLYNDEGIYQWQIGEHFGVDQPTVHRWLNHYNIPTRGCGTLKVEMPSKSELDQLYTENGMTQYQIGKHFGVHYRTVGSWLKQYKIPTRGNGTSRVEMASKSELEQLYTENDMDQRQIAKQFGVHRITVGNWLKHYEIQCVVPMPPKSDLEKLINDGLNQHQIAKSYDVCDGTVFNWCERLGISGMVNGYRCHTPDHINWKYAVFQRDHHTCQMCGATKTYIEAHHIVPYYDHPELECEVDNGITLCKQCHKSIRGYEYDYVQQFAAITQPMQNIDYIAEIFDRKGVEIFGGNMPGLSA